MNASRDALIIGAGIAGMAVADALASRGLSVMVAEKGSLLGSGASGNAAALLSPYLDGESLNPTGLFYQRCFEHARNFYSSLPADVFYLSGLIQMPSQRRITTLFATRSLGNRNVDYEEGDELTTRSGVPISRPGCFLRDAGTLNPTAVLESLRDRAGPRCTITFGADVVGLSDQKTHWEAVMRDGKRVIAEHVVISTSYEAARIAQTAWLPLEPIRGEVWLLKGLSDPAPRVPIAASAYFIPNVERDQMLIGATYRHNDLSEAPEPDGWRGLLARAEGVSIMPKAESVSSRVSFRTSTHDRLPFIGAVPDFDSALARTQQKRPGSKLPEIFPLRNLWVSAGHGSRGFSSAPLAAAILADQITGAGSRSPYPIVEPERVVPRLLLNRTDQDSA
jgi:tRNA 5-methylaminomethyl-2-thiouridine biosynthesis bifunctional protein